MSGIPNRDDLVIRSFTNLEKFLVRRMGTYADGWRPPAPGEMIDLRAPPKEEEAAGGEQAGEAPPWALGQARFVHGTGAFLVAPCSPGDLLVDEAR